MTHKLLPWVLLYCLSVVPLSAFAEGTAEPPAAADAGSAAADGDAADAADAGSEPQPAANDLAFDPAAIGLPGLPLPMTSQDDFSRALMLIDERIAQLEAAVAETEAHAQEADAAADGASVYEELGADVRDGDTAAASPDTDPAAPPEASAETNDATDNSAAPEVPGPATTAHLEQQVETLKAPRVTVQRRATLAERLGETVRELKNVREGLETIERDGLAAEPPYPVSLLDQTQAELASKQAVERVAETRLQTASRRKDDTEKPLSAAVRERRAARDRLRSAETDGAAEAERRDLAQALELARLTELLLRQELAAATNALELARTQDRTAEAEQALLKTRIEYLRSRVIFPQEALEQRLTELSEREETLRTQMDVLSTAGDRAEASAVPSATPIGSRR